MPARPASPQSSSSSSTSLASAQTLQMRPPSEGSSEQLSQTYSPQSWQGVVRSFSSEGSTVPSTSIPAGCSQPVSTTEQHSPSARPEPQQCSHSSHSKLTP